MRLRSLVLIAGVVLAAFVFRRRTADPRRRVDVFFDDGSMIRLQRGPEAADLLDDAAEILAAT
jgi:hypothetical protein